MWLISVKPQIQDTKYVLQYVTTDQLHGPNVAAVVVVMGQLLATYCYEQSLSSGTGGTFIFAAAIIPTHDPTQLPTKVFHTVKRSEYDADHVSISRIYATSRKVGDSIPHEIIGFFNSPNPSSRTMALSSTQPLTEMSTRNLLWGKGRPARKADNLTAICEPIV
jgi:hypothetical protein